MSRRRYDRDFNNFGEPGFRGNRDIGGIFGLVFSLVSLGLTIAFNVLGILLSVFTGLAGSKPARRSRVNNPQSIHQETWKQTSTAADNTEQPKPKQDKQQTINKEKVKETFNQSKEEKPSDWNLLLFIFTLIPIIITLAMKRLDLAGLTLAAGTATIIIYNLIRSAVISSKKKKKEKQAAIIEEDKKDDTDIERAIKEAFDKVYAVRKELYRISKQEVKHKLESLCDMAEKIIGEVRTNPECMNSVRKFFYYYLDAFIEVFEKYTKLSSFSASSEEVQKLLAETEKSFDDMSEIFQELCENMLEKDMLNLKATINVIKNSNYSN